MKFWEFNKLSHSTKVKLISIRNWKLIDFKNHIKGKTILLRHRNDLSVEVDYNSKKKEIENITALPREIVDYSKYGLFGFYPFFYRGFFNSKYSNELIMAFGCLRSARRGRNDLMFYNELISTYSSMKKHIHLDCALLNTNGYTLGVPDFYIEIQNEKPEDIIKIDIEIDEPYCINEKKEKIAIHYFDEKGTHKDEDKDIDYLHYGCDVFRFAEHQVINYTSESLKLIFLFIRINKYEYIDKDDNTLRRYFSDVYSFCELIEKIKFPCWKRDQALNDIRFRRI